jgi:hypothetical protein
MTDRRGAYRVLVGRPEGKRLLGRPKYRCEDNIKMFIQEVGCEAHTGLMWFRIKIGCGSFCESGNKF